jgi:hypothetical protein
VESVLTRWHHGHSLATGALLGLTVAGGHLWLLLALAFLAGAVVALAVERGARLARWLAKTALPMLARERPGSS